jgi:hypothetical protein
VGKPHLSETGTNTKNQALSSSTINLWLTEHINRLSEHYSLEQISNNSNSKNTKNLQMSVEFHLIVNKMQKETFHIKPLKK